MAVYVAGPTGSYNSYYDTGTNTGIKFKPLTNIKVTSVFFMGIGYYATAYGYIYNSSGTILGQTSGVQGTYNTSFSELTFNTPITLVAGQTYMMSVALTAGSVAWGNGSLNSSIVWASTPAGGPSIQSTDGAGFVSYSSTMPSTQWSSYTPLVRLGYEKANEVPKVTALPVNGIAKDPRHPVIIDWTYSDAEGNAQDAYQIQYREMNSGGAWTTVTGTTASSHTFAANTFTLGKEYEYQVRVSDAVAGYGDWSNTAWFMAATSTWTSTFPVNSSTQSGLIPGDSIYEKQFNADITGWESNGVFGTYQVATLARTTTRPYSGETHSLEVTWPNGSSWINSNSGQTILPATTYMMIAELYVPSGSPNVSLDPLFMPRTVPINIVSQKDQWVTATQLFSTTPTATDFFFGIKTETNATSGQKMWVRNMKIVPIAPNEPGEYYIQVRTADAEGFGPWSSSATFSINQPPGKPTNISLNPTRVGGNINVTWTYSDPENNPQTKYQIQYRKVT